MGTEAGDSAGRFSLVQGGPFHATLRRIGLVGADGLPTQQAAIRLALFAWVAPALLVVAQSMVDSNYSGWGFFADWTVYTRYLVAIWAMIATERYADGRIELLVRHFREARLLPEKTQPAFAAALAIADRRSSSTQAEAIILAAALVWSGITASYTVAISGSSWDGLVVTGEPSLSWAGEFVRFVSTPLFLFLVLRWIWRFQVWAGLLFRISRLPLQLAPLHPDRSAGLGFLAIFPSVFNGFIFALSCVVASAFLKEITLVQYSAEEIWFALAGWLVMILLLFLGPLLVFVRPLYRLREQAILDYGRLASHHHLAFHRKWVADERSGEELMGSSDPSSASDLNQSVQAVQEIRVFPVNLFAVVQIVLAAGTPMLLVITHQIPFFDLVKWVVGTIL